MVCMYNNLPHTHMVGKGTGPAEGSMVVAEMNGGKLVTIKRGSRSLKAKLHRVYMAQVCDGNNGKLPLLLLSSNQ